MSRLSSYVSVTIYITTTATSPVFALLSVKAFTSSLPLPCSSLYLVCSVTHSYLLPAQVGYACLTKIFMYFVSLFTVKFLQQDAI